MKAIKIASLFFFFFIATICKLEAQTVYITDTGKKYHAKNCSLAKTGKKGISIQEAIDKGYTPCKVCKADAITPLEQKEKKTDLKGKKKV
jgi:hypothetical protein